MNIQERVRNQHVQRAFKEQPDYEKGASEGNGTKACKQSKVNAKLWL